MLHCHISECQYLVWSRLYYFNWIVVYYSLAVVVMLKTMGFSFTKIFFPFSPADHLRHQWRNSRCLFIMKQTKPWNFCSFTLGKFMEKLQIPVHKFPYICEQNRLHYDLLQPKMSTTIRLKSLTNFSGAFHLLHHNISNHTHLLSF